ncbi:MAG: hypothetical protein Q8906_13635 [Bacillota bacterium]|nr:hypothetical protein [Bacillota bacterium]
MSICSAKLDIFESKEAFLHSVRKVFFSLYAQRGREKILIVDKVGEFVDKTPRIVDKMQTFVDKDIKIVDKVTKFVDKSKNEIPKVLNVEEEACVWTKMIPFPKFYQIQLQRQGCFYKKTN